MELERCLNLRTTKLHAKKFSCDLKQVFTRKQSRESTKHSIKPSEETSTHRFTEYQHQAKQLRGSNTKSVKRILIKSKKANRTVATKGGSRRQSIGRDPSAENSQRFNMTTINIGKKKMGEFAKVHKNSLPGKAAPKTSHVAPDDVKWTRVRTSSKGVPLNLVNKQSIALNANAPDKLGVTQPVKGISAILSNKSCNEKGLLLRKSSKSKDKKLSIAHSRKPSLAQIIPKAASSKPQTHRSSLDASKHRRNVAVAKAAQHTNKSASSKSLPRASKKLPMSAVKALKCFSKELSDYEKGEMLDYETIYYLGRRGKGGACDDARGNYVARIGDHVAYRYEMLDLLGKGSFGQAIRCKDHKTGIVVALKIIKSKKKLYQQAMVEVKILKYISDNDREHASNIVKVLDYFLFRRHICISFEVLSVNLYERIKQQNFRGFSLSLTRKFAVQMLRALAFLKTHSIIHCDIKPENILLRSLNRSDVELIDFGSSCFAHERVYTYIQSRFYRAPEIMLGIPYTSAIDMWSFGCVLAELYSGFPLFPGENEPHQLGLVMEVNGPPPERVVERAKRRLVFFDEEGKPRGEVKCRIGTRKLESVLGCKDREFVDFLRRCLEWEPRERMTPEEALVHPWILSETQRSNAVSNKPLLQSMSNLLGRPKEKAESSELQDKLLQLKSKIKLMTNRTSIDNKNVTKENVRLF